MLACCGGDGETKEALGRADLMLEEQPDSALAILAGIDTTKLTTAEMKARYSLLRTVATLKSATDKADTGMLVPAYEYYGHAEHPSREAMLTHYAEGALSDVDIDKIEEYTLAIDLAGGDYAPRYKTQSWLNISELYDKHDSGPDARYCIDMARKEIMTTSDTTRIIHTLLLSGINYNKTRQNEKAILEFKNGLRYANEAAIESYIPLLKENLAYTYSMQGKHNEAIMLFDSLLNMNVSLSAHPFFSYLRSLAYEYGPDKAFTTLKNSSYDIDEQTKAAWYYTLSRLYSSKGDDNEAIALRDSMENCAEGRQKKNDENNVVRQEREKKKEALSVSEKKSEEYLWLAKIFIVAVIVLSAIYFIGQKKIIRKYNDIVGKLKSRAAEMENKVCELTEDYKKKHESLCEENSRLQGSLESERITISRLESEKEHLVKKLAQLEMDSEVVGAHKEREILVGRIENLDNSLREAYDAMENFKKNRFENFRNIHSIDAAIILKAKKRGLLDEGSDGNDNVGTKKSVGIKKDIKGESHSEGEDLKQQSKYIITLYRNQDMLDSLVKEFSEVCEPQIKDLLTTDLLTEKERKVLIYELCGFNYVGMGILLGVSDKYASVVRSTLKSKIERIGGDYVEACRRNRALGFT